MKKINHDTAEILKHIVNQELKDYKHITLDHHYKLPSGKQFLKLTVIYEENSSYMMEERKNIDGHTVLISYIPKISIQRNLKYGNEYLFTDFPHSTVVKDENRFLVNMKSSIVFFVEKNKTLIHKKEIDALRWKASGFIDSVKFHDSKYLRYKVYESLIDLYNYFSPNDYIPESSLPVLFSSPDLHPYVNEMVKDSLSSNEFYEEMMQKLEHYGGFLKVMDSKASLYSDEIVVVFKHQLSLDSFLENVFLHFFSRTKKVNHQLKRFYWEKDTSGFFSLYLNADKEILEKEILPELQLKLNSVVHLKQISDVSTVYDFMQEYCFEPLHRLAVYVMELKTDEHLTWTESIAISYCIELYISCFIKCGFSKDEFFAFNRYLSQKWQLLLLSDEELISQEYFTLSDSYQKFEKLYLINENTLVSNFSGKIEEWTADESFLEEITVLQESMESYVKKEENNTVSRAILSGFSGNTAYAFLEGFLYKSFGLMGLETESKVYLTYIINRLSNEN